MRRHALSGHAFAELGAGRPSLATVAELRRAEVSRHLLLLRALRPSPGYARLRALEREDPVAFRRAVEDPLTGAWAAAQLRAAGAGAAMELPRDNARRLVAEHGGLSIEVRLEDADDRRGLLGLTPTGRLTEDEAAHWERCFTEAWRVLASRHRDAALLLRAVLTCVVPVEADPAAAGISATSADAFGAVAMSMPADGVSLAVGLLHEAQHSLLNATSHLFDLHERPRDLGYSPWRDDPRPASGILHGAYAYLAVTRFWRTESAAGGGRVARFEYERWREAVSETADRLLAGGTLTRAGSTFVAALAEQVRPWSAEPCADPEIARLARMANADHYARWRLRNMTPDPAGVAALAQAWRAGTDPQEVRSTLRPPARRALPHSPRLHRIHALLREDASWTGAEEAAPGGDGGVSGQWRVRRATASELAFLRGDQGTFRRSYLESDFDLDPTALAIAAGAHRRIEALVALWQRLGGEGVDPVALADWLGTAS